MKLTVNTVVESSPSLGAIGSLPLHGTIKFRLARVIKQVQDVLKDLNEAKTEIFKREGILNKDKTKYDFPNSEIEESVNEELKALGKEEVEIIFDTFAEKPFEDSDALPVDLANCAWLFGGFDSDKPKSDVDARE